MFYQNQTAKWLKYKDNKEKKKLFKACIKVGRDQRQLYKQPGFYLLGEAGGSSPPPISAGVATIIVHYYATVLYTT